MISVPIGRDSIQSRRRSTGGIVDIVAIVSELKKERDRLNRAIAALEGTDGTKTGSRKLAAPTLVKAKKGGRRLTAEGRKRLSEMMKKRWAERRRKGTVSRKAA
jgi:hypothetical protein